MVAAVQGDAERAASAIEGLLEGAQDLGARLSGWLEDRPVTLSEPRDFVATVCLVRHLDPLPEGLRDQFVQRVLARCGKPLVLEYVRLNMLATRG